MGMAGVGGGGGGMETTMLKQQLKKEEKKEKSKFSFSLKFVSFPGVGGSLKWDAMMDKEVGGSLSILHSLSSPY